MSRIADALRRAGLGGAAPDPIRHDRADMFPAEFTPRETRAPRAEPALVAIEEPPEPVLEAASRFPSVRPGEPSELRRFKRDAVEKLVVDRGAKHSVVEEFRKLAATLHHAQALSRLKVLMITSASSGEGKTLTTVNLGLTLSESYRRRVLLVDADLRKPSLHDMFDIPNGAGLLSIVKGGGRAGVPLTHVSPRLAVVSSGGVTPDPIGPLTSEGVAALLRDASEAFDWVLIDTPPAALVPDCSLLAPHVDGVLLVLQVFRTPYPLVETAIDAVGRDKILGVVMNRAVHSASTYSSGYYGG